MIVVCGLSICGSDQRFKLVEYVRQEDYTTTYTTRQATTADEMNS